MWWPFLPLERKRGKKRDTAAKTRGRPGNYYEIVKQATTKNQATHQRKVTPPNPTTNRLSNQQAEWCSLFFEPFHLRFNCHCTRWWLTLHSRERSLCAPQHLIRTSYHYATIQLRSPPPLPQTHTISTTKTKIYDIINVALSFSDFRKYLNLYLYINIL